MQTQNLDNVAYLLKKRALEDPHLPALKVPIRLLTKKSAVNEHLTYLTLSFQELNNQVEIVCQHLSVKGIMAGQKILVLVRPGYELILIAFALFRLQAVPVIIDPGMGLKNFLKCVQSSQPNALIAIPEAYTMSWLLFPIFKTLKTRILITKAKIASWIKNPLQSQNSIFLQDQSPFSSQENAVAAIVFTSGSTGAPKGVCYTHTIFHQQLELIQSYFKIQPGEVDLSLLPLLSLFNPALGMTTVVPEINPSRPISVDPSKIVEAIQCCAVTNTFGSPAIWSKVAIYCEKQNVQLPTLKRVLLAGASVPTQLLKRLRVIMPHAALYTPYGATECLPLTCIEANDIFQETENYTLQGYGTCVGKPLPGMRVKIIKPVQGPILDLSSAQILPAGEIGEVLAQGPVVTSAYYNNSTATQESKVLSTEGLWHRVGDLGYLDAQDRLWFCGRKVERVTYAPNQFLYTDCCEAIVNTHPVVYRSALIGLGEPPYQIPVVVVELIKLNEQFSFTISSNRKEIEAEILYFLKNHSSSASVRCIQKVFIQKKLPVDVRHNAKIHRLSLKKKYENYKSISILQ